MGEHLSATYSRAMQWSAEPEHVVFGRTIEKLCRSRPSSMKTPNGHHQMEYEIVWRGVSAERTWLPEEMLSLQTIEKFQPIPASCPSLTVHNSPPEQQVLPPTNKAPAFEFTSDEDSDPSSELLVKRRCLEAMRCSDIPPVVVSGTAGEALSENRLCQEGPGTAMVANAVPASNDFDLLASSAAIPPFHAKLLQAVRKKITTRAKIAATSVGANTAILTKSVMAAKTSAPTSIWGVKKPSPIIRKALVTKSKISASEEKVKSSDTRGIATSSENVGHSAFEQRLAEALLNGVPVYDPSFLESGRKPCQIVAYFLNETDVDILTEFVNGCFFVVAYDDGTKPILEMVPSPLCNDLCPDLLTDYLLLLDDRLA